MSTPLVEARGLSRRFEVSPPWLERVLARRPRQWVQAVDGIDLAIERGRTLALVGESGCGKTTVARLLVGLLAPSAGSLRFDGADALAAFRSAHASALRRRLQMVFQDPYASLNPRWRVQDIVAEPLVEHRIERAPAVLRERVAALLGSVGLSPDDAVKYPHQFSGGQRQRISIARALASAPEFLVCDEPTSALDVSVQAQVLNLMRALQAERGLTYLFISHNLAVVRQMSDTVGVMVRGRVVELAPAATLFAVPRHPYTRMLLDAVPDLRRRRRILLAAAGDAAEAQQPPGGCNFAPRCPHADARCRDERPALLPSDGHQVACHAVSEGRI